MEDGREDRKPWDKWYWQDWSSDPGVQACGFAAKGFWMDLLSIMAKSKIRGKLLDNKSKMDSKTIAKLTGSTVEEIEPLLAELRLHGVYSEDADGVIFNRRMARGSEISRIRSEAGKLGGRPKSKEKANGESKTKPPSASASAYASSSNKNLKDIRILKNNVIDPDTIMKNWNSFAELNGLPKITEIEKRSAREAHLRARMAKKGFDFDSLLETIGKCPFLLGQIDPKPGSTRFFATFDWIIDKTNYQKIVEGNYLERTSEDQIPGSWLKKMEEREEKDESNKDDEENF